MKYKWIIWYAILQHLLWGIILLLDSSPLEVTAIHSTILIIPHNILPIIYITISILSVVSISTKHSLFVHVLLLIPQQFMLFISGIGAILAMIASQFADGVVRPRAFLIADQAPAVLIAILHSCAIIEGIIWKKY